MANGRRRQRRRRRRRWGRGAGGRPRSSGRRLRHGEGEGGCRALLAASRGRPADGGGAPGPTPRSRGPLHVPQRSGRCHEENSHAMHAFSPSRHECAGRHEERRTSIVLPQYWMRRSTQAMQNRAWRRPLPPPPSLLPPPFAPAAAEDAGGMDHCCLNVTSPWRMNRLQDPLKGEAAVRKSTGSASIDLTQRPQYTTGCVMRDPGDPTCKPPQTCSRHCAGRRCRLAGRGGAAGPACSVAPQTGAGGGSGRPTQTWAGRRAARGGVRGSMRQPNMPRVCTDAPLHRRPTTR